MPRFAVILALCATLACGDDPLTRLLPRIAVEPETLDFGDGVVMAENLATLKVKDIGEGVLQISGTRIEPGASVFTIKSAPDNIPPTSFEPLEVVFVPLRAHESYQAELVIASNDPDREELRVPLKGVGGVREIEVEPTLIDFGEVDEGTRPRRSIAIRNVGKDALVISGVTWTSTSVDLGPVPGTFASGTLMPGTSTTVDVEYSPTDLGADEGTFQIASNDEDEPVVTVTVIGRGNLAPRAIAWGCALEVGQVGCPSTVPRSRRQTSSVRGRIGIDGQESFDPEGGPITSYRWVVASKPPSSTALVFHTTEDRTLRRNATGDFEVDVVGRYDLRLIVKDARGIESLDRPESHILLTPKDLEVLLRWDLATDADLHLVRPNGMVGDYGTGAARTSTGSDCSTFNRAPNWRDPMTPLDDPRLDIDDVSGDGPEIISLDAPEPGGTYQVYAHYCDSRRVRVPVNVTLEVYVRGELMRTLPEAGRPMARLAPGELLEMARITWDGASNTPSMIVDASGGTPVAMPGLCLVQ